MIINLRLWKFILTCMGFSFLVGCASTGSPSGGDRDTDAPVLVVEKSTQNFSTNFTPEKLELVFDEWIELKNQQREILISPPFFQKPKITSRGKKITVEFPKEEPLRADATYTLNFGKSIVDFTEGNAAEGFRFVFATGDKIDSLSFSGSIADAKDSQPVKDILVLLYDIVEDSVVLSEKPFYYARTDDSGNFKFENLKNDTFKLLVLEDLNFNYLLDPEVERLAFPDSLLILNDSSTYNPKLRLFKPEQSLRVLNSSSQTPGLITAVFNKKAEEIEYSVLYPNDFEPIIERSKDTLMFWFDERQDSVGLIFGVDTLDFTIKPFDSLFYSRKLSFINSNSSETILAPFDSLQLSFSSPLAKVDTAFIRLTNQPIPKAEPSLTDTVDMDKSGFARDSLLMDSSNIILDTIAGAMDTLLTTDSLNLQRDSTDILIDSISIPGDLIATDSIMVDSLTSQVDSLVVDSLAIAAADTALIFYPYTFGASWRDFYVNSDWKEKTAYRLELLPGALTDIYGRQNDTLVLDFKTAGLDEFGNIAINLSGMDSAQHYIILLKLNEEVVRKSIRKDSTLKRIEHNRLRVNTYSIELIKDDDGNGEWTTGDYWLGRQPEELKTFELEKLRENWDLEAEVFWNEPVASTIDTSSLSIDSLSIPPPPKGLNNKNEVPKSDKSINIDEITTKKKGKND